MDLAVLRRGLVPAAFALLSCAALAPPVDAGERPSPPVVDWDDAISKFQADAEKFVGQRITFTCPHRAPGAESKSGSSGIRTITFVPTAAS